jgi:hypothetical protein
MNKRGTAVRQAIVFLMICVISGADIALAQVITPEDCCPGDIDNHVSGPCDCSNQGTNCCDPWFAGLIDYDETPILRSCWNYGLPVPQYCGEAEWTEQTMVCNVLAGECATRTSCNFCQWVTSCYQVKLKTPCSEYCEADDPPEEQTQFTFDSCTTVNNPWAIYP